MVYSGDNPTIQRNRGLRLMPKKFWNIGIRIEDDVLVTKDGSQVLTEKLTRDPDEIEALMAAA